MKITSITFALGETINVGNFNSVRVDISATAEIEHADFVNGKPISEVESAEAAYAKLRDAITSKVAAEVAKHTRQR